MYKDGPWKYSNVKLGYSPKTDVKLVFYINI